MSQIICGIDVGFAICGWSIVEKNNQFQNKMKLVDYGAVETSSKEYLPDRLLTIYSGLENVIKEYKPDEMCVEDVFFFKNQKTVISVAQVRGVILLLGKIYNLELFNYTPLQVKTALTGYGRADKSQIQKMVQKIFGLKEIPKPDDAADAIAIAVCHCNNMFPRTK